jgi:hypothetical protein
MIPVVIRNASEVIPRNSLYISRRRVMIRWIGVWTWVLYAYLCGKVLHRKKYLLLRTQYDEDTVLVRFSFVISEGALQKLMYLWRCSEVDGEKIDIMLNNVTPATAPFLGYDSQLPKHSSEGGWAGHDPRVVCAMVALMVLPLFIALVEYLIALASS